MLRIRRIPPVVLFLTAALTLVVQAHCAPMPNTQETATVTDSDNGRQVSVARGGTLTVRLEAIPGTGYGWKLVKAAPDQLTPLGESVLETSKEGVPGAREHQVFRFRAQAAGSGVLELHSVRPWEKDVPPAKTYRLEVQVR